MNRGTFDIRATNGSLNAAGANPGRVQNFGTINTSGALTFRDSGGGVRLTNSGTVHVLDGTLTLSGGVAGGGTWTADANTALVFAGRDSSLTGATLGGEGEIRIANRSAWTDTVVSGPGSMSIASAGQLKLVGTASAITRSAITNDGNLTLDDGAMARIESNLTNSGQLSLGTGDLTVTGDLTLTPTSMLRVRTSDEFTIGHLNVQGHAALDGTLTAEFAWAAPTGMTMPFMTVGSSSGNFATVTSTGLLPGQTVEFRMIGNTGSLAVNIA